MKIAVRADASSEIGTGHLRRCLSLAEALKALGAEICFVIRRHDPAAEHVMAAADYPVHWLPEGDGAVEGEAGAAPHAAWAGVSWQRDVAETVAALRARAAPDWVIVDHYAFDARWHEALRAALGCRILAVDDLGDRPLAADMLLDGNAAESHAVKYAGQLPAGTRMLVGPRFAPLSAVYRTAARYLYSPEMRSIGVFMGGTDAEGLSAKVVRALRADAGFDGRIEVVSTSANADLAELARFCDADGKVTLSVDLPELAAFYARHDLQIGAGGTSSYERCCIGAPTVAVVVAPNQLAVVPILSALDMVRGAAVPGVEATKLLPGAQPLGTVVRALIADPEARRVLSENSRRYVDGRGAERVALSILADCLRLRPATMDDAALLHMWRNDPATRSMSINTEEIAYEGHVRWLTAVLKAPTRKLYVAMVGDKPVGVIRFDLLGDGAWEISLYMDPDLQGLGLGKRMLLAGEEAVARAGQAMTEFHAQVVTGNVASMRMFESAGYRGGADRLVKVRHEGNAA